MKEATDHPNCSSKLSSERLLDLIRQLVLELHPQRRNSLRVTIDSSLDRDLGFDSLSVVELLQRLENYFGVNLPEQLLSSAETPHDLWRAVLSAIRSAEPETSFVDPISVDEETNIPHHQQTR